MEDCVHNYTFWRKEKRIVDDGQGGLVEQLIHVWVCCHCLDYQAMLVSSKQLTKPPFKSDLEKRLEREFGVDPEKATDELLSFGRSMCDASRTYIGNLLEKKTPLCAEVVQEFIRIGGLILKLSRLFGMNPDDDFIELIEALSEARRALRQTITR